MTLAFEGEEEKNKFKNFWMQVLFLEWASPTVLIRQRDGTVRYCIDLRKVNEVTIKESYPLPKISACIDALVGCEYFFLFGYG